MKILVPTLYPTIGGSTRVLLSAAKALRSEHDVVVRGPFVEADEQTQTPFPELSLATWAQKLAVAPLAARLIASETRELKGRGFEIIYVHDNVSLYVYGMIAKLLRVSVVRHMHQEGSVFLERLRTVLAGRVITISKHSYSPRGAALIRNPVRPILPLRAAAPEEVVIAGRICALKNQMLGVEALSILRKQGLDRRLRLCGDVQEAGYAAQLRRRASELGIQGYVSLDGFVRPQDYLASASCMLMPSLSENQPLALLEAIAAEVPVVASDIPAHRELVGLGCLPAAALAPLTAEGFAEAITRVQQMQSWEQYASKINELFSQDGFSAELCAFFRSQSH